jgi:23S rRNA pseudouridine1911/1915/1917 synthase
MAGFRVRIILEDKNILVVDKPAGLLSIATLTEENRTMYHYVREYLQHKYGKNAHVFVIHRLDKDTSGLMVFAKSFQAKVELQSLFEEGKILRYYQALLVKSPEEKKGTIVNYLCEDRQGNVLIADPRDPEAKKAITKYEIVGEKDGYPEAAIQILTGRKNQIRIGLADIGCPIVGDRKFGKKQGKRMMLVASMLDLRAYHNAPAYLTKSTYCLF